MIKLTPTPAFRGLPVLIALACFALSPAALATDGGLPNQNTAEGTGALSSLNVLERDVVNRFAFGVGMTDIPQHLLATGTNIQFM